MDSPNEMFNRLMAYGMSRADALAVIKKAQEIERARNPMAESEIEMRHHRDRLDRHNAAVERWRKLEAIADKAVRVGIGKWTALPSTIMPEGYNLSEQ